MMFQSALLASKSSEEKGNMSSRPCKKGKSGWIYSVTSTSFGVIKPKESDGNFKTKEKKTIYPVISLKLDLVHLKECLQLELQP